jgi:hypothetical protein
LVIPGTSRFAVLEHQATQAQQPSQSPELPLTCPHAVLVNVLEFLGSSTRQTDPASLDEVESPRNDSDSDRTHPDEEDPMQAQLPAEDSPGLTEASLERMNKLSTSSDPREEHIQAQLLAQNSPNLSEVSLEHLDEFSTFPNQPPQRRDSVPAESNIPRLVLESDTSSPPNRRHTKSLPADRNDWDEYQERLD